MGSERTDAHIHLIYGVDDGAKTPEDMQRMLDEVHRNGITTVYATSHRTPGYREFPVDLYGARLAEANAYCRAQGYPITVLPGAEILYTPALHNEIEREELQTLGDTDVVLAEFVPNVRYEEICTAIELLQTHGFTPMLAHIERYACLAPTLFSRGKAYALKKKYPNVLLQVNCGAVLSRMQKPNGRYIEQWFRAEMIDCIASDAHDCGRRKNRMQKACDALAPVCSPAYMTYLTTFGTNG